MGCATHPLISPPPPKRRGDRMDVPYGPANRTVSGHERHNSSWYVYIDRASYFAPSPRGKSKAIKGLPRTRPGKGIETTAGCQSDPRACRRPMQCVQRSDREGCKCQKENMSTRRIGSQTCISNDAATRGQSIGDSRVANRKFGT